MTFGEKLQALRKARGWSQEELATQINVSRQALSKWESSASVPDTENVIALSRLFGVTTDYLLLPEGEAVVQAAPAAATKAESNWPVPRVVWLMTLILAILGKIALRVWASILPPTDVYNAMGWVETRSGMQNLIETYDISWLIFLTWVLLLAGFAGTVFYKQFRAFFVGGWLK